MGPSQITKLKSESKLLWSNNVIAWRPKRNYRDSTHDDHFQCSCVHSSQVGVSQQVGHTPQLLCQ